MELHDATDYRFPAPGRQLLIRQAEGTANDLEKMAKKHAVALRKALKAKAIVTSALETLSQGKTAVVVTATLPALSRGEEARIERTAFLAFPGEVAAQLTLQARSSDSGAEGEFRRLLESAMLAPMPTAEERLVRTLEAGEVGKAGYPVGNLRLDLTEEYQAPPVLTLTNAKHTVTHTLERAAADPGRERATEPTQGTLLSTGGIGQAMDHEGRRVRFEVSPRPWMSPGPGAGPPADSPEMASVARETRGPVAGTSVTIRGVPLVVRTIVAPGATPGRDQTEALVQRLKAQE